MLPPCKALGEGASGGSQQRFVFLSSQARHCNLCLCHHMAFSLCVCLLCIYMSVSSPLILSTPVILE